MTLVRPLTLLLLYPFILVFEMPFLCKHPSMLPRALCASQCPPHNVFHSITEYPEYYDPLYFPKCHVSLFETEQSVCAWTVVIKYFADSFHCLQFLSLFASFVWKIWRFCVLYFGFFYCLCCRCWYSSHTSFCRVVSIFLLSPTL